MKNTILVTGATGHVGKAAVEAVTAKGFRVKAACRHPDKIPAARDVQPVRLDYSDPASLDGALAGVTRVFLVAPPLDPEAPGKLKPVIEKAKALHMEHIVLVSAMGVDQDERAPLRIIEHAVMDSGVHWTILRPTFFMENFSTGFVAPMIKEQSGIFLAAGSGKTSFISAKDVAAVAASAFADQLFGKVHTLTGPNALDHEEVARIVSSVVGREIRYHTLSEEAMLQGAREAGVPESAVRYMAVLYAAVRAGYTAQVTDDVKRVTGKDPTTFEAFARANKDAWK